MKIKIRRSFRKCFFTCHQLLIENKFFKKDYLHLHPTDLSFDDLTEITGNKEINPSLLNNKDLRGKVVGAYYKLMKKIVQNLVRNSDAYILTEEKLILTMGFPELMTLIN